MSQKSSIASNATSGEASCIELRPAWRPPYEGPAPGGTRPMLVQVRPANQRFPKHLIDPLPYLPYQVALEVTCYLVNAIRGSAAAYFRPPTPVNVATRSSLPGFR
jgi:hypothetical protein